MKPTNLLLALSLGFFTFFTSCKKESSTNETDSAIETTFEMSADNAISDYMAEDDNDVLMEAAEEQDLLGNFVPVPFESNNFLACASVTVTPQTGFPKTIVITFDPNCTNPRGIIRSGIVRIVISAPLRNPGSTAVMTFDNYFVNGFKREGTHTWTNTSQPGSKSWQRKIENGKITAPGGRFWLYHGIKNIVQTAGVATPRNLFDDVFSITGNASITNPNNVTRTSTILTALQKKYACANIDKGTIKFQGPDHYAILDYGNGDCDRVATISIDGRPPRQIILR